MKYVKPTLKNRNDYTTNPNTTTNVTYHVTT